MTPKISIIMPVYNAEQYLQRAINSILAQTFQDWELICINDGSTDGSQAILDEYASKDVRVKIKAKLNEGVAIARQLGVDSATAEYSIHFDSDDWAEPTMLEEMYQKAKAEDADVLISDFYINSGKEETISSQKPLSLDAESMLKGICGNLMGSCWNKLIKTELFVKYHLSFTRGINYCEDRLLFIKLYLNSGKKTAYLPKAYYHYWVNNSSITHNVSSNIFNGLVKYRDEIHALLPNDESFFTNFKSQTDLSIFHAGFMYGHYDINMIKQKFQKVRRTAYNNKSLRWKLGYLCIDLGLYSFARKLIRH